MKTQWKVLGGFAVGAVAGAVAGCQTYNFEPVSPLAIAQTTQDKTVIATQLKPNVMIVVDKSGSMTKPVDPFNNAACQTGNPNCPFCGLSCGTGTTNCPTNC
ncbi:MAG TPA: VWA domain-containing protein, partial [Myxococcaceae bacterium]|nr:VWA domain-containing protein [Myxococcaceae bacterium]